MTAAGFSLATSFDDRLLAAIAGLPVDELYGRVEADGFGGGRPRFLRPRVGWRKLARHVAAARAAGCGFNYLLNSAAEGSGEAATPAGLRRLRALVDRLAEIGVAAVTVVSPFYLRLIRRHSSLKVRVSAFARVDDERKALAWFDEGAERIVLDSMLVNRDPERLARLAAAAAGRGELELLVNNRCDLGCAWAPCHAVDLGAASTRLAPAPDACFLHCHARCLAAPARLLAQDWIRPEDLRLYEELGYRRFKIAGRGCSADELATRARAYAARRHEGNLVELFRRGRVRIEPAAGLAAAFAGGWRALLGLQRVASLAREIEERIVIDNRALDGYLDQVFRKGGCLPGQCRDCPLCDQWAARAVTVPAELARRAAAIDDALVSGALWQFGETAGLSNKSDFPMEAQASACATRRDRGAVQ